MLTNRGRWLVLLSVCGCALGIARYKELLAFASLTAVVWLIFEWLVFRWRVEVVCRSLEASRTINGQDSSSTLWMNRPAEIELTINSRVFGSLPFVQFHDFLSAGLETEDEAHVLQCSLQNEVTHRYSLIPKAAGRYIMPGVCTRISDLHGLFYAQRFLPCSDSFRVMPSPLQADSIPPLTKSHNSLMPPGMHRFLRAGSGPELLELREYAPGDPPKSIAWKVSARKGSLMTRQYESEVPVRATLFVDCSAPARVGIPGHRAIDTAIATAATLAKSLMADRDPVGLVMYGDSKTSFVKHGAGERHLFRILDALANQSFIREAQSVPYSWRLLDKAWTVCDDLYPELLDPQVNQTPFFILPLRPHLRRTFKRRLQMAAVLADIFELPADGNVRLAMDDAVMAKFLCQFLDRIGSPWMDAVYNAQGRNIAVGQGRLGVLADALTRSIATSRDNEVFVLIADLIDHHGSLGRLRDSIRMARARHHRVVVICPWPAPVSAEKLETLPDDAIELTQRSEALRLENAAEQLRSELRRMQVPFAMATEGRSVRMVLAEAGMARDGRTAGVGVR
ncbi:MAG: DUF58 domain-containing protein [Planctomycetaceae bacterium]